MGSFSKGGGRVGLDKEGSKAEWKLVDVAAWASLGLQCAAAALLAKDTFKVT